MAFDAPGAISQLIQSILGGSTTAMAVAGDPGAVAATGYTEPDGLTVADLQEYLGTALGEMETDLSAEVQASLAQYAEGAGAPIAPPAGAGGAGGGGGGAGGGGGGAAPAMPQPVAGETPLTLEVLQEQLQYITAVAYENNPTVINQITEVYEEHTNIDNSINLEVGDDFEGDIDIEATNVNATGDGAVAAGEDVENAVTGDGSVLVDGDANAPIVAGDGNVLNQGTIEGGVATGAGAVATGTDSNAVVGEGNTALQTDGTIQDVSVISGDVGGDAVSIGDVDDASLAFGDGATATNISDIQGGSGDLNIGQTVGDGVTNVDTDDTATSQGEGSAFAEIDDAAIGGSGDGDVGNISNLQDGSAASLDGDATGSDIDDAFNDNEGPVTVEQGEGDQEVEQSFEETDIDDGGGA